VQFSVQAQQGKPGVKPANAFGKESIEHVSELLLGQGVPGVADKLQGHIQFVVGKGLNSLTSPMYAWNGRIQAYSGNPRVRGQS
jgi:hypothetical protein